MGSTEHPNRRDLLQGAAGAGLAALAGLVPAPAGAAGARVHLHLPERSESGASVPLGVSVDSPMTADDHVTTLRIVAPSHPVPEVATFRFTPASGRAAVATRIRLPQGAQDIQAIAEMSDGSVLTAQATVLVTVGGCTGEVQP